MYNDLYVVYEYCKCVHSMIYKRFKTKPINEVLVIILLDLSFQFWISIPFWAKLTQTCHERPQLQPYHVSGWIAQDNVSDTDPPRTLFTRYYIVMKNIINVFAFYLFYFRCNIRLIKTE